MSMLLKFCFPESCSGSHDRVSETCKIPTHWVSKLLKFLEINLAIIVNSIGFKQSVIWVQAAFGNSFGTALGAFSF
jgi:hypothetical protein